MFIKVNISYLICTAPLSISHVYLLLILPHEINLYFHFIPQINWTWFCPPQALDTTFPLLVFICSLKLQELPSFNIQQWRLCFLLICAMNKKLFNEEFLYFCM